MKISQQVEVIQSMFDGEAAQTELFALRQAIIQWIVEHDLDQYTGTGQVFYNARANLNDAIAEHLSVEGSEDPALISYYYNIVDQLDEVAAIRWLIDDIRS